MIRAIGGAVVVAGLAGCSGGFTTVNSTQSTASTQEIFWAKNKLAEQTDMPGEARFGPVSVYELDSGDRVYCGAMRRGSATGAVQADVPFYLRASGERAAEVTWTSEDAGYSSGKCAEAAMGRLRVFSG